VLRVSFFGLNKNGNRLKYNFNLYNQHNNTMMSIRSILVTLLSMMAVVSAFTTVPTRPTFVAVQSSTTSLNGLFDFLQPPKKAAGGDKRGPLKQDANVFAGRGKRITIREDEDNAMWVEEPKDPKKKKGGK
jgi:hypothetical protein